MKLHLERLSPDADHYIGRLFEEPLGEIDPETGQPWKKFSGVFVLSVVKRRGEVKAMVSIPARALSCVRSQVAALIPDLIELFWWRWSQRTKKRTALPL